MYAADRHTLLLFDEIGSGTEPNEGAALAIAILEEFYHMGCITVATTHYGRITSYNVCYTKLLRDFDKYLLNNMRCFMSVLGSK